VRSPELIRGAKDANAISLRLAASIFVCFRLRHHGRENQGREKLYIFTTSGPRCRRSFFQCGGKENLSNNGRFRSEGSRQSSALTGRGVWIQLLQLRFDFAPFFGLAFSGIRSVGVEKKSNSSARRSGVNVGKFCSQAAEQLGMRNHSCGICPEDEFAHIEMSFGSFKRPSPSLQEAPIAVHVR